MKRVAKSSAQIQASSQEQENRHRGLLGAIPDLVFLLDLDGRFVDVLGSDDELLLPRSEFIGRLLADVLPEPLASETMTAIREVSDAGGVRTFGYEIPLQGERRWYEARVTLAREEQVVVIVRDLTVRRQIEAALRRSESMLAESQRIAGLGSWEDDRIRSKLSWSEEIYRIFGESRDAFEPSVEAFFQAIHPDDRDRVGVAFGEFLKGETPYDLVHRIVRPDGEIRWVHERAECVYDPDGVLSRIVGTALDVTERTLAEQQLRETNAALEERTAQLRRLSQQLADTENRERQRLAMLLHDDLQQLLVASKYQVAAICRSVDPAGAGEAIASAVATLDSAIKACRSLAIELRPPVLQEGGLAEALKWLGYRVRETHGLAVEVKIEADVPVEEALATVMFNAVRELLLNVTKYAGVAEAGVVMSLHSPGALSIVVSDRGCGFEPSAAGAGEAGDGGFGLFAIRERLAALGGTLGIESGPGEGCRVTLVAPLDASATPMLPGHMTERGPDALTPDDSASPPPAEGASRIRILIVDDHEVVRQGLSQLLSAERDLLLVGDASNGTAAISKARALQPDVVLMDVNMPGMNGIEATRALHAEFPAMKIIGLSMYEEGHRAAEMRAAGASDYVSKHEAIDRIVATIRSCCLRT